MVQGDFLNRVTPIILTFNEEPNIARCLDRLGMFKEVLVVDSGSTDATLEIIASFANTRLVTRSFDSFSGQWNYAIREGGVQTEWVLAMDADYILTDNFLDSPQQLLPVEELHAYRISFEYCVFGKPLSATLYPPIIALYRHAKTHYVQDGHCMRAQVPGQVGSVAGLVRHDDRKPLSRWIWAQDRYAVQEAELLMSKPAAELRIQDKLRKLMVVTPWLVPMYCLTVGRGLLDGWPGIFYALQRGVAEAVLSLKLLETKLRTRGAESDVDVHQARPVRKDAA